MIFNMIFKFIMGIRGFHVYKIEEWSQCEGEVLELRLEEDNKFDPCAVAVVECIRGVLGIASYKIVGLVPISLRVPFCETRSYEQD